MPIDYSKYPANWKSEIRPAVLARAKDCCEFCGVPNFSMQWRGRKKVREGKRIKFKTFAYESKEAALEDGCYYNAKIDSGKSIEVGIYQTKVVLTIAHLDHDETNHNVSLDRLAALCQLCHLQYDAKEKYRRLVAKSNSRACATRKVTLKGEKHTLSKLTDIDREEIRSLKKQGHSLRKLGKTYNVSCATIHEVCHGKDYSYRNKDAA